MSILKYIILILFLSFSIPAISQPTQMQFETDTIPTEEGELRIMFIGHGTLMFDYDGTVIHVDPVSRYADYSKMPKADLILVTHHHGDHLDPQTIGLIRGDETAIICTETAAEKLTGATIMKNGEVKEVKGIQVEAVPAYNLVHKRNSGEPYHPKGIGNGYVLSLGGKKVYIAGDTENVPEMKNLSDIDIAFLPMNLPYTMTPEMVADAVNMIRPKIFYPYHYGSTDMNRLVELLKETKSLELRIRDMK